MFGTPAAVSATGYEDLDGGVDVITATLHYKRYSVGGDHRRLASQEGLSIFDGVHGGDRRRDVRVQLARGSDVTLYDASGESRAVDLPQKTDSKRSCAT